jgi:RimJ/RimL family protein N-acetyltransferase
MDHRATDQVITTPRLVLREWKDSDNEPFALLNADPRVMEFMSKALTRVESDVFIEKIKAHFAEHGFGLFAASLRDNQKFVGYIGLSARTFKSDFAPYTEIGWRLAAEYWNKGLATEGARAVLRHSFTTLNLPEVVSYTVPSNIGSRRVMEKIGLVHQQSDDFDHPNLPAGHPLRRHVLYRLRRSEWIAMQTQVGLISK